MTWVIHPTGPAHNLTSRNTHKINLPGKLR